MTQTTPTTQTAEEVVNELKAKAKAKASALAQTTPFQSTEVAQPTDKQEETIESQLIKARNANQMGILSIANKNSDVLASQAIQLTKNLTAYKVATQMAQIFEGDGNIADVTTSFLSGIAQSGYQIKDAIANLEVAPPLLYQAIGTITEAQPLLNEATETKQLTAA